MTLSRWLLVLVTGLVAMAAVATPVNAHAFLLHTDPEGGATLSSAPDRVTLTFNEPIEVPVGGLRVLDASADRIDLGLLERSEPTTVAVGLPEDLTDGSYIVAWRVISADSHPVAGVFTFRVGDADDVEATVLADALGGWQATTALRLGQLVRAVAYAASLVAAGAALVGWLLARDPDHRRTALSVAGTAALVGLGVALIGIPVQLVTVSGDPSSLGSAVAWREVLASSFGTSTLVRSAALALLLIALVGHQDRRSRHGLAAAAGLVAAASWVLDGHQRTVEPTWQLVGGGLLHLGAASVWLGGLVVLVSLVRGASRSSRPLQAATPLALFVSRFSTLAAGTVLIVVAGGLAMAAPLVGSPEALPSTSYGRLLLFKVAATGVVLLVAGYNRFRLVPQVRRDPSDGWRLLARTLRLETVLLAVVLAATGVLATTVPAVNEPGSAVLYRTNVELNEDITLQVWLDDRLEGRTTVHLFVVEPPPPPERAIEDLRLAFSYPAADLGPITVIPFGDGNHFLASLEEVILPGDWEMEIIAGLDRFTEARTTVTLPLPEN